MVHLENTKIQGPEYDKELLPWIILERKAGMGSTRGGKKK